MKTIQQLTDLSTITTDGMIYGDQVHDAIVFSTVEEAIQYILHSPVVSTYGGYELEKMCDEEIIHLANKLIGAFKMLAEKYRK